VSASQTRGDEIARVVAAPGSGWPGDHASADTPVAHAPSEVENLSRSVAELDQLDALVSVCRACPRLVEWREQVAVTKRASFVGEPYWGRPVTGLGPPDARVAVVGLAPAAHGGNRTGRVFTGDRSGDWLFASLHRLGLAKLPISVSADDGQQLIDVRMLAAVRCAPPQNMPTPAERATCRPWLARELELLRPSLRVVVALGGFAWAALWPVLKEVGYGLPPRRAAFGHLAEVEATAVKATGTEVGETRISDRLLLLGSYHPSQQNTFTGRLTEPMLDAVFARARSYLG
jgi:uracil-DNA glycosylase family 4